MNTSTLLKINDIFYSGGYAFTGNKESAVEIAFLVDNEYLNLNSCDIAHIRDYRALLTDYELLKAVDEASGGSFEHIVLKILGNRFLDSQGIESVYEHPFCGYYPDVLSTDNAVVIECGHTANPEKILQYFKQGNVARVIQIPYPDNNDTTIMGYEFSANPDLKDFLTFRDKDKASTILNILNRKLG